MRLIALGCFKWHQLQPDWGAKHICKLFDWPDRSRKTHLNRKPTSMGIDYCVQIDVWCLDFGEQDTLRSIRTDKLFAFE